MTGWIAEQGYVNTVENSSKLNYTQNAKYTHNTRKKMKHRNINRPKDTAGLSIKLSINMRALILMEGTGYKRLVLDEDRKCSTVYGARFTKDLKMILGSS